MLPLIFTHQLKLIIMKSLFTILSITLLFITYSSAQVLQPYESENTEEANPLLSLTINNGATTVKSHKVILTITASDFEYMMVANDKNFEGATWISYKTEMPWELIKGEGKRTVYIKFKNNDGEESARIFRDVILWKTAE